MGHGAGGAQGRRRRVGVEVGLGGEVGSGGGGSQVGVHSAVAGAVVREGVRSLGHRGSDVGLLPSVAPGAVCTDVLLSLDKEKHQERAALGAGHTGEEEGEVRAGGGRGREEEGGGRRGRRESEGRRREGKRGGGRGGEEEEEGK